MTGSEKGHIYMTSGEHQPEQGRHRHSHGTWTPEVTHAHPPSHARPDPVPPPTAAETTVPGLRKFDLGTIPASVTPPKTWRKAAWFAIGASLAVVFGLAFAAAALVGRPKNTETIDALPGVPSAPMYLDASDAPQIATQRPTTRRSAERSTVVPGHSQSIRGTAGGPATSSSSVRPSAPQTSSSVAPPPYTPPVRETTPKRALATNDPKQIGDRTEAFYNQITSNPGAAFQMTTGEMRGQGEQAFRERYADIKRIEVRRISIDPNQGTTVSEVKVTKADGTTFTERRRLKFTSGRDPKISSEVTH